MRPCGRIAFLAVGVELDCDEAVVETAYDDIEIFDSILCSHYDLQTLDLSFINQTTVSNRAHSQALRQLGFDSPNDTTSFRYRRVHLGSIIKVKVKCFLAPFYSSFRY
jgi:hypothetical protein